MRKVPEIEQKLNELVTLSVRLGDSSHHAQSVTRVLDLKKDWSALKSQVTQHANALKVCVTVCSLEIFVGHSLSLTLFRGSDAI